MILTKSELNEVLKELDGWKIIDKQLSKEFKFKGFIPVSYTHLTLPTKA